MQSKIRSGVFQPLCPILWNSRSYTLKRATTKTCLQAFVLPGVNLCYRQSLVLLQPLPSSLRRRRMLTRSSMYHVYVSCVKIALLPDKGERCVSLSRGRLRTESQGLPSRHTTETSSPDIAHTAMKDKDSVSKRIVQEFVLKKKKKMIILRDRQVIPSPLQNITGFN